MIAVFIFIFGAIIGSFLNVVILRYNTGLSIMSKGSPRSHCFSCHKVLKWYELIPILSFFIQRGHCRTCYSRISWQYPIVEILTGLVFLLIYLLLSTNYLLILYYWFIFSLLIVISVYDIRHKIIPNKIVWLFVFLSLFSFIFRAHLLGIRDYSLLINNIFAGLGLALPFALLWLLSKGKLMGLGDAKLALGIGFLLGLSSGITALLFSFWIGAIFGIILLVPWRSFTGLAIKKAGLKTEIPFGPFLILATFIVFILNLDFNAIIQIFTF